MDSKEVFDDMQETNLATNLDKSGQSIASQVDISLPPFEIISDQLAEILRRKTVAQRLRGVDAFWISARSILRASIRFSHPQWSNNEVNREIARRISNGAIDHVKF